MEKQRTVLGNLLERLEELIDLSDRKNTAVSKASVGWHIAHTLITMGGILDLLEQSDPKSLTGRINLAGWLTLKLGWIPKGRGKAPRVARPEGQIDPQRLQKKVTSTKEKLDMLSTLDPNAYFKHPYFGELKLKWAIRFIEVHTKHHLKIMESILK